MAFASCLASAQNLSDHWFNPDEPGWGLTITQQGDVLFGVLLVYSINKRDASGKGVAEWYVAPAMRRPFLPSKTSPLPPLLYTGALYLTSGLPPGVAFDPAATQAQRVGEMTLTPNANGDEAHLRYQITYSEGSPGTVHVEKRVRRMSLARLALTGQYMVTISGTVNPATTGAACGFVGSFARAESWLVDAEGAGGGYRLLRTDADLTIADRVPVDVVQAGSTARLVFRPTLGPLAGTGTWTVMLEHVGTGGWSGTLTGRSDGTVTLNTDMGAVVVPNAPSTRASPERAPPT
jgi:hypothetical protein